MKNKDKEHTMQKLLEAVGIILKEQGFAGIGVNKVARQAGVDKRLIYRYFGSFDNLITEFISTKDYWLTVVSTTSSKLSEANNINLNNLVVFLLEKQFDSLYHNRILRQIMLWGISEHDHPSMTKIIRDREKLGQFVLQKIDNHLSKSGVRYRSVAAILIAGISYLTLHAHANNGTYCGIDLNDELGQLEIKNAIRLINELVFDSVMETPE